MCFWIAIFLAASSICVGANVPSAFDGGWQLIESKNFDAYMKELGIGILARTAIENVNPSLAVSVAGNTWKLYYTSFYKNYWIEFELNKEVEHETFDGRWMKSIFSFINGKLIQKESPISHKDKSSKIVRYVDGDRLIVLLKCGTVEAKRVYQRTYAILD
ncbi:hypothetical protein QR680_016105 [Steinernema hermaphroditum]|uniref:Cytosolic fatty-acid binding proteins domain-containing protein n=1 Tax=Steinernema hermaphroditum TaxID=289476 RepID=A0AA39LLE2_9BILA|nr:hypothetical protein QR680_016105 [Steinernema hermaphroditum]